MNVVPDSIPLLKMIPYMVPHPGPPFRERMKKKIAPPFFLKAQTPPPRPPPAPDFSLPLKPTGATSSLADFQGHKALLLSSCATTAHFGQTTVASQLKLLNDAYMQRQRVGVGRNHSNDIEALSDDDF